MMRELQWLLHNYEPWETEEILCINEFIQDKYKDVLDDVTWDFYPEDPETSARREDLVTLLGADGSGLFDHVALLDLVSQHVTASDGDWLFEATDIHIQHNWRRWLFTDGDEAQDSQKPMPFRGDGEHLSPLAWVIIWKETYSNFYGAYIMGSFREWGYVMWDAGRLISSGGADTLKTEWGDFCTEADGDL
ncbi:hypothetical protein FAGAP_3844 [Fusarium agapanthi]|uniref:Uncharacterized protein n=1 Tax=Fusarium agapanthi TaxID=1803897 RepID=A0A9P5BCQ1_9HYPO|nr:hypothetical protein FAGAP_3844 [Fusarium agapanthi]